MHPLGDSLSKRAKNMNFNSQVMPAKDQVFRDITGLKNKESNDTFNRQKFGCST